MKKVLIHHNNRRYSVKVKYELEKILMKNDIEVVYNNPDVIAVIGGDGTMLSAITKYKHEEKPFIGIDTGTLGFLNTVLPDHLEDMIKVLKGECYRVNEYPLLKVVSRTIRDEVIEEYAFNEILIKHVEPKLMEAKVYFNNKPFNYFTGDGFIISTPIGSTGYAIWAGGAAIHGDLPVYQITPIAPNDNSVNRPMKTPMVLGLDTSISIEIVKAPRRKVIVACDGSKVSNDYISSIYVSKCKDEIVRIIRFDSYDYLDLFRRKIIDKNIRKRLQ